MSGGSGGRRRKKHPEHEEHENHERWLVSYADMMTLLLVLFVVLFAMSQVDKEKFAALASGLSEAFGAPVQAITGPGTSADASVLPALDAALDVQIPPAPAAQEAVDASTAQQAAAEAQAQYDSLDGVRDQIDAALTAAGYAGAARYEIDERGLVVHIVSDPVLFDAESATLLPQGRAILEAITPAVAGLPNQLDIEGHANHLPVTPGGQWPSNWELSTARASTVVRHLAGAGVPEPRMGASGYSSIRPMVPETDPGAVTLNRRVDIVVLSTASAEANELLPGLDAGTATPPTGATPTTPTEGGHP